jgi:hypothetical protein
MMLGGDSAQLMDLTKEDALAMTRVLDQPLARPVRAVTACVVAVVAALVLAACGSSSHTANLASKAPPINRPCEQVSSVLSDGPDPGADPVGYAQAQVLQLRMLKLSEPKLATAVAGLASAYQAFSQADGHSDQSAVNQAQKAVNAICPGAAN